MLTIGITGSVGTGKSTVSKLFQQITNGNLIDADIIAKNILQSKEKEIIKLFGTSSKETLAEIVFNNVKKRHQLEEIIHPLVTEAIKKNLKNINIIDIPLLFEADMTDLVDVIIVVSCSHETQIKRLSNLSEQEAILRINAQMPLHEKEQLADFIIENENSINTTKNQVKKVWDEIKQRFS